MLNTFQVLNKLATTAADNPLEKKYCPICHLVIENGCKKIYLEDGVVHYNCLVREARKNKNMLNRILTMLRI